MASLTTFTDEARIALDTLAGRAAGLFSPSLRLGVTGLSRAGKTVFISSLVHNLIHGGRLPLFEAQKSGRIARAFLEEQPDDAVPRFQYEDHIEALVEDRVWPDSTRAISELRLTIEYESASGWNRLFSSGRLSIDIVDYPGEWLLDLPLLGKTYAEFSREAVRDWPTLPVRADSCRQTGASSRRRRPCTRDADEMIGAAAGRELRRLSQGLQARRARAVDLAARPLPDAGRPRGLAGPDLRAAARPARPAAPAPGSLHAMMERRYEAYKTYVVKPFFREHIARLDRQIVLIDAMQALNAGAGCDGATWSAR